MKELFKKIKVWWSAHAPSKRRLIQVYSALLFNASLKGYITGDIFKGATKNMCTPGLNCYSCPGAVTSCPLGALQNAFSASGKTVPFYMLGILVLYAVMLGRWICGWLCPFGLVQDLLHKIKTPKLSKGIVTRILSFFKYVLLVLFVVIIPLLYVMRDLPLPAFCKYICPAGTFGGAIGLLINPANDGVFAMLGPLFSWKFALMVSFLVATVFIYRVFCRFFCPLGAFYGLFNRIAVFGIKLDRSACTDCGKCITKCKMDIREVGDHECIMCGECIEVCPTDAISWRGAKIFLPKNEFEKETTSVCRENGNLTVNIDNSALAASRMARKKKNLARTVCSALSAILLAALVYFNFIEPLLSVPDAPVVDTEPEEEDESIPYGHKPGYRATPYTLKLVGGGSINIKEFRGKVVVINFWGTWCGPCVAELPHFDEIAEEYSDDVVVIAIHSVDSSNTTEDFVREKFNDSLIKFAYDLPLDDSVDMYFDLLGGTSYYPRTLVLDENGVITYAKDGSVTYGQLEAQIKKAMGK